MVELLPFQNIPIKHLVSRCKNQHGLLINWQMGSGKTYLGSFFAKNYPNNDLVIILPNGLQNIWLDACKNIGVKIKKFITYEQLRNLLDSGTLKENIPKLSKILKNSILILDEAHNLIKLIDLLLSEGVEQEEEKFDKETGLKSKTDKKIKNETKNLLDLFLGIFKITRKNLLLSGTPIIHGLGDIRWLINIAAGKKVVPYNSSEFTKKFYKMSVSDSVLSGWINKIMYFQVNGYPIVPYKYKINILNIEYYKDNINNIFSGFFTAMAILYSKNKKLESGGSPPVISPLIISFITTVISKGAYMVLKDTSDKIQMGNFESLDVRKMSIASPYISFYSSKGSPDYPTVKNVDGIVTYTDYQLELWTRLIYNVNITDAESVNLELNKDISEAELFKPVEIEEKIYVNKGRIIGNLYNGGEPPLKFVKILDLYKKNKISTVVYSNFYKHGILLFSKFLSASRVSHTIYHPGLSTKVQDKILEDFKNKKITLLLLHPDYFEGFNISACRIFHVLEPVLEFYKQEQLYARGVRYKSHSHLPLKERNIVIVQWKCTLKDIFDKARQLKTEINDWVQNDSAMFYFSRLSVFDSSLSPDDMISNYINRQKSQITEFSKAMGSLSIDNKNLKDTCCIYGDTECKKKPNRLSNC